MKDWDRAAHAQAQLTEEATEVVRSLQQDVWEATADKAWRGMERWEVVADKAWRGMERWA